MFDWHEIGAMARAVAAALAVHVLMAALVVIGTMDWQPFRKPQPTHIAIEAVIVDTSEIRKQRDEARQAQEMEARRQQREEQLRQQRERERLAEEEAARKKAEAEGPAIDDIPADQLLEYIEMIRDIMEFSDVESGLTLLALVGL